MIAEPDKRCNVAVEATEKLQADGTVVALQSKFKKVALEEMDPHRAGMVEVQEQVIARSAKLSQL